MKKSIYEYSDFRTFLKDWFEAELPACISAKGATYFNSATQETINFGEGLDFPSLDP